MNFGSRLAVINSAAAENPIGNAEPTPKWGEVKARTAG
jgi:hypothetical protein